MSAISDMIRQQFKEGDDIRDAGLTSPEDIQRYDDIQYGEDATWQVLDLYKPKAQKDAVLPVIVSVHGGGWVYGDKERYQYYCMSLAQHGFAVVNFTYRLAPEFKFPLSLEDTNMVFQWVFDHAQEYGLDTKNVFGVGDSAGAHMLSIYSAICTNKTYAKQFPFATPEGFVPSGIALNCGAYNIELKKEGEDLTTMLMADFLPKKGTKKELSLISPLKYVTKSFPPTFIMTAQYDFLRNDSPLLAEKLSEKNVMFIYRFFSKNNDESLAHVFHCNMKMDMAHQCNKEECDFFKSLIK
ncbi:MAG: alpha/beta hydrolase [Firmicutes bacterium]|nr:alpha/beta hydrolase [Bacillota bacterium]